MANFKFLKKSISSLFLCTALVLGLCGCDLSESSVASTPDSKGEETSTVEVIASVDASKDLKLDMSSDTLKEEVTVENFVDGDTVHFNVPKTISEDGVLKARFLAVNTPESTGKVEEYGKTASLYTRGKLEGATSIIIESDDSNWNLDSTGGRYLVWVWYKTDDSSEYSCLNVELLQHGLARASSSSQNRYGDTCTKAIQAAKEAKVGIYSGEKDPNFFYGDAIELDLKELRANVKDYVGSTVAFEGVVTKNGNNGVYVENYDPDTDMYYGIYVYYGFGLSAEGVDILKVGNRSRIVGTVSYYENGGTYQVSGLTYRAMKPDDPGNIKKISEGNEAAFKEISANDFASKHVSIETSTGEEEFELAYLLMDTSVSMKDLKVEDIYTTNNPDSSSNGAMTLTCEALDGTLITVRTEPLYDENQNLITKDEYLGKTIDVKGIVGVYKGNYQVKVLSDKDITIK